MYNQKDPSCFFKLPSYTLGSGPPRISKMILILARSCDVNFIQPCALLTTLNVSDLFAECCHRFVMLVGNCLLCNPSLDNSIRENDQHDFSAVGNIILAR